MDLNMAKVKLFTVEVVVVGTTKANGVTTKKKDKEYQYTLMMTSMKGNSWAICAMERVVAIMLQTTADT